MTLSKPELLETVGENISRLRLNRGWTLETLADKVISDASTISRTERGLLNITIERLQSIAEALGVTVSYLTKKRREPKDGHE